MILSELHQKVKNDLSKILEGYYDDKFSKEQLLMLTKISFLLNHIKELSERFIQFSYAGTAIKINTYTGESEEAWINIIMNEEKIFIKCLGKDDKIHVCEPHSEKTLCGVSIKRKKLCKKDFQKYSCYKCSY